MGHDAEGARDRARRRGRPLEGVAALSSGSARRCWSSSTSCSASPCPTGRSTAARAFRYLRATEPWTVESVVLSLADRMSTRGPRTRHRHVRGARRDGGRAAGADWRRVAAGAPPLLRGDEIAKASGCAGSDIGTLVDALAEEQAAGTVTTREEAMDFVRDIPGLTARPALRGRGAHPRLDAELVELVPAGGGRPRARRRRRAGIPVRRAAPAGRRGRGVRRVGGAARPRARRASSASSGDADALPFEDGSFDIVTCVNVAAPRPASGDGAGRDGAGAGARRPAGVQDYLADPDPEQARELGRDRAAARSRATGGCCAAARCAGLVGPRGLAVDDETEWTSNWDAGRWISMAEPDEATAARLAELIGSERFQLIDWRRPVQAVGGPAPRTPQPPATQPGADQLDGVHRDVGRQLRLAGRRRACDGERA